MSKEKLVPKLRFPEFANNDVWQDKSLTDISNITNGNANAQDHVDGGKYPLFDRSEVVKLTNNFLFDAEAVIIPGEGMRFIPKYFKGKFNLHQRAYALKDFSENGLFIYYSVENSAKLLAKRAVQSTVLSLRLPILQSFPIKIPKSKKEQQKIADCLSSLDDIITAQTQKLDFLKTHKKGLMQDLFPAEGESVPRLRFGEFEGDGEWEEKILSNVCKLNPSAEKLPNEFIYIDLESVQDGILLKRNLISLDGAPSRAQRLLKNCDIIYQTVRPYQKNNFFFDEKDGFKYVASTGYAQLRAYESSKYLFHYIHTDRFVEKVLAKCTGSNYPAINSSTLAKIPVNVPSNAEQQKIADCLSSLDDQIQAQTQKIDTIKLHKKGLMQQLFPNTNDQ